jgi:hypothetical protein
VPASLVNDFFTVVVVPVNTPVPVVNVSTGLVVRTIQDPTPSVSATGTELALVVPVIDPLAVLSVEFAIGVLAVILPLPKVNGTADPPGVLLIVKSKGELMAEI